ncbi:MAG: hypothetical protein J6U17_00240 [Kiritimatiellae bacterium]|jgi:Flp pilus assembly pilin Flp|nr:hypothetical protein [Kiritimatiellia bacterium]
MTEKTTGAAAKRRPHGFRRGAVMMEYVVLAVLIAAACVIAVIVFGRGVVRNTDLMNKAAAGRGSRASEAAEIYQGDVEEDVKEAQKFTSQFSDTREE